jgi:hypothetical protein
MQNRGIRRLRLAMLLMIFTVTASAIAPTAYAFERASQAGTTHSRSHRDQVLVGHDRDTIVWQIKAAQAPYFASFAQQA